MNFDEIKVGRMLFDRWWPWKHYRVTLKLKTRIKVVDCSSGDLITYDRAHCQFLESLKCT